MEPRLQVTKPCPLLSPSTLCQSPKARDCPGTHHGSANTSTTLPSALTFWKLRSFGPFSWLIHSRYTDPYTTAATQTLFPAFPFPFSPARFCPFHPPAATTFAPNTYLLTPYPPDRISVWRAFCLLWSLSLSPCQQPWCISEVCGRASWYPASKRHRAGTGQAQAKKHQEQIDRHTYTLPPSLIYLLTCACASCVVCYYCISYLQDPRVEREREKTPLLTGMAYE